MRSFRPSEVYELPGGERVLVSIRLVPKCETDHLGDPFKPGAYLYEVMPDGDIYRTALREPAPGERIEVPPLESTALTVDDLGEPIAC